VFYPIYLMLEFLSPAASQQLTKFPPRGGRASTCEFYITYTPVMSSRRCYSVGKWEIFFQPNFLFHNSKDILF